MSELVTQRREGRVLEWAGKQVGGRVGGMGWRDGSWRRLKEVPEA